MLNQPISLLQLMAKRRPKPVNSCYSLNTAPSCEGVGIWTCSFGIPKSVWEELHEQLSNPKIQQEFLPCHFREGSFKVDADSWGYRSGKDEYSMRVQSARCPGKEPKVILTPRINKGVYADADRFVAMVKSIQALTNLLNMLPYRKPSRLEAQSLVINYPKDLSNASFALDVWVPPWKIEQLKRLSPEQKFDVVRHMAKSNQKILGKNPEEDSRFGFGVAVIKDDLGMQLECSTMAIPAFTATYKLKSALEKGFLLRCKPDTRDKQLALFRGLGRLSELLA